MVLGHVGSDDFIHELFFFLHVLCAIVGFGATFSVAIVASSADRFGVAQRSIPTRLMVDIENKLIVPFTLLTGLFGVLLILTAEDDVFEFSDTWISIAFLLFIVGAVIGLGFIRPASHRLHALDEAGASGGGSSAEREAIFKRIQMLAGINHLIFLLLLIDMVWKPGWP